MNLLLLLNVEVGMTIVTLKILGDSTVPYGGNDKSVPSCGARVVIETEAKVEIVE